MQNGVWLVNPNILMKGNDTKRQILLSYYQNDEPIDEITMSRTKKQAIPENSQNLFLTGDNDEETYKKCRNGNTF